MPTKSKKRRSKEAEESSDEGSDIEQQIDEITTRLNDRANQKIAHTKKRNSMVSEKSSDANSNSSKKSKKRKLKGIEESSDENNDAAEDIDSDAVQKIPAGWFPYFPPFQQTIGAKTMAVTWQVHGKKNSAGKRVCSVKDTCILVEDWAYNFIKESLPDICLLPLMYPDGESSELKLIIDLSLGPNQCLRIANTDDDVNSEGVEYSIKMIGLNTPDGVLQPTDSLYDLIPAGRVEAVSIVSLAEGSTWGNIGTKGHDTIQTRLVASAWEQKTRTAAKKASARSPPKQARKAISQSKKKAATTARAGANAGDYKTSTIDKKKKTIDSTENSATHSEAPKKRKRTKKDPNAPKGAATAYNIFFKEKRREVVANNPKASSREITKLVGSLWQEIDFESKNKYRMMAANDKKRYASEKAAYDAKISKDSEETEEASYSEKEGLQQAAKGPQAENEKTAKAVKLNIYEDAISTTGETTTGVDGETNYPSSENEDEEYRTSGERENVRTTGAAKMNKKTDAVSKAGAKTTGLMDETNYPSSENEDEECRSGGQRENVRTTGAAKINKKTDAVSKAGAKTTGLMDETNYLSSGDESDLKFLQMIDEKTTRAARKNNKTDAVSKAAAKTRGLFEETNSYSEDEDSPLFAGTSYGSSEDDDEDFRSRKKEENVRTTNRSAMKMKTHAASKAGAKKTELVEETNSPSSEYEGEDEMSDLSSEDEVEGSRPCEQGKKLKTTNAAAKTIKKRDAVPKAGEKTTGPAFKFLSESEEEDYGFPTNEVTKRWKTFTKSCKDKPRDPNVPKRAASACNIFYKKNRRGVVAKNPGMKSKQISKLLSSMWKELDQESKERYKKMAADDKQRYVSEMAAYDAKLVALAELAEQNKEPSSSSSSSSDDDDSDDLTSESDDDDDHGDVEDEESAKKPAAAKMIGTKAFRNKKKKKMDTYAPKGTTAPFDIFFEEKRPGVLAENRNASHADISSILVSMWRKLDSESKKKYKKMAAADKQRGASEKTVYDDSMVVASRKQGNHVTI